MWPCCPEEGARGTLSSSPAHFPDFIAVGAGSWGMGFLMKYHIETGGYYSAKLSSLFIKVSGAALPMRRTCDQKTPEVCPCVVLEGVLPAGLGVGVGVSEPVGWVQNGLGRLPNFFLGPTFVKSLP